MIGWMRKPPTPNGMTINTSVPAGGTDMVDGAARQLVSKLTIPIAAGPRPADPVVPEGLQAMAPVGTVTTVVVVVVVVVPGE